MAACLEPTRAVSLFVAGIQCELTDYERLSLAVENAAIHHTVLIVKHPEVGYLFYQPFHILARVLIADTKKDQVTCTNLALYLAVNGNAGVGDSLYNRSHLL